MLTALGVMGALMVIRNPFYLQSGGFLLSFTSVLGIGVIYPALGPMLPAGQKRKPALGSAFLSGRPGAVIQEGMAAAAGKGQEIGKALVQSFFSTQSKTQTNHTVQHLFYY